MLDPDVIVQELYRRYGIVIAKDDPVVAAGLMNRMNAEDDEQRQATWLKQSCAAIDESVRSAQAEGRDAGEKQFAAKAEIFLKSLDEKTAELCGRIARQGSDITRQIEATAASITEAHNRDALANKIDHTYMFVKGIYWCLVSLVALSGIGLIGKIRGWF
jgi:hypothetical protein